jgi:acyl-CoA synthetase (AMP-forming)/AMP-acid ligase II
MSGQPSFTDHLLERAAASPHRAAMLLLADDVRDHSVVSYADLDRRAKAVAAVLQARTAPGDRVLVVSASRRQFAIGILACLYSGAIGVPVAMPGGRRHHGERIAGIVKDTAAACALTDTASAAEVSQLLARAGYGGVTCLAIDAVSAGSGWRHPRLDNDSVALLLYTSGSTRDPRGVVVTQGNLSANQAAIQRALHTDHDSRFGGWLPLYHDMGLVGQLLHPLWLGASVVLLRPRGFARRPVSWLEMISEYGLTVSGAPDFAYDLCARLVSDEELSTLDLTAWRTAVNGGDMVRPETVRAFTRRFAPAGFRAAAMVPCYGLAESTLLVTGAGTGAPPTLRDIAAGALGDDAVRALRAAPPVRTLIGCGPPAGCEVRIVDAATRTPLPDGRAGEIWVRGSGVGQGYWRRRGESRTAFQAATVDGAAGFLRTGDLGMLLAGELFVTGRIKDVVVVAGRTVYPDDVERSVRTGSPLFAANAVFGVPGEHERVVIVQEVHLKTRRTPDFPALTELVRARVEAEFDMVAGGVVLVRVGSVRRTTSGKVERAAMRRLFLDGRLKALYQVFTPDVASVVAAEQRLAAPATRTRLAYR